MSASGVPIGICYLALTGAFGLYMPYLSLYLSSVGLTEAEAVQVQAVVPFVSLIAPPLFGLVADARHARIWLLRGLGALAMVAFAVLGLAGGNVGLIAAALAVLALACGPLVALTDATAHDHVRLHGGSYGRLRTWGSLGYLVTALLGGTLYDATSIRILVWVTMAAFGMLVLCAWWMPEPSLRRETGVLPEVGQLLRTRSLWLFLVAVVIGQAAGSCYGTTLAFHFAHLGYGKDFFGLVIGVGVLAEMVFVAISGSVLARVRREHALAVAFAVAALRYFLLSVVTSRAALLAQAPLHAVTFGLYWVSVSTIVSEYAGPRASAAGQGVLAAAVAVGSMIGSLYGGALLERGGGQLLYLSAAGGAAIAAGLAVLHAIALRHAGRRPLPAGA